MAQENNIAQQLNDLLVTRDFYPDMRDARGKDDVEPKDAKVFTFNYVSGAGKNYGTMVIILDSGNDLKVMFGNNLGRSMEDQDKNEWFAFQQQLSQFANKHRWTYTGDDISKLKYTMQGLAAIKEGLFEGYYGTRRISYAGEPTEARLMIRHNRNLGETDARFRYVESIFIETADGERFRLPFTNLAGGRAMLEHVRQGGKPYDVRGNHICEMITELKVLARFNRASQGRVVEGITQGVVEGAQTYYKSLRENIKRLSSPRGYSAYFESWHPADITEQDQLVEDIKTLFVEQTIDDRIEQALPLLAKIQQGREMKEAEIFENWVNNIAEGTWSLPETPEQMTKLKELMSGELIVGPDGTNATEQLYDLIGDDELFDRIDALAEQDPRANVWDDTEIQARMQELGVQMPDRSAPDMAAQPQPGQGVAEGSELKQAKRKYNQAAKDANLDQVGAGKKIDTMKKSLRQKDLGKEQGMDEADNISTFESLQRMASLAGVPLAENALNDSGSTLGHIIQTYQQDVRDFIKHGSMSDHLYDELYDYYFDAMPYGVKKARTGDPHEWIGDRFYDDMQGHPIVDECLGGIVGEAQPQSDGQTVGQVMRQVGTRGLSGRPAPLIGHQSDGQTVGQVMSQVGTRGLSGRPAPLSECNYTMEGHFCPVHGLTECWSQGMYEDILSTGIQLAEDDDTKARAKAALDDLDKPDAELKTSSDDAMRARAAAQKGTKLKDMNPIDRDQWQKEVDQFQKQKQTQQTNEAPSMMNPKIRSDFGSDQHLQDLVKLAGAYKAGDRAALKTSNDAMLAKMTGQGKAPTPAATPSFGTPGAAHAGQQGYDYQDEEPKGQAHSGQGGYNYYDYDDADQSSAETARLGRLRNPNVDPALAHMLINPNNPDAFAMQRDEAPDQSDAETARLNKLRNPNVHPDMAHMLTNPNNPDAWTWKRSDFEPADADQSDKDGNMNEADAPAQNRARGFTNPNFQSRQLPRGRWWGSDGEPPTPTPANPRRSDVTKDLLSRAANKARSLPQPDTDIPDIPDTPDTPDPYPVFHGTVNQDGTVDFVTPGGASVTRRPLDQASPLPDNTVTPVDVTRESREGDALLARIKSLALIR